MLDLPTHDGWRVRVLDANGKAHGCGVLVAPDLVLTCAHVAGPAAGGTKAGGRPANELGIAVSSQPEHGTLRGTVVSDGWVPAQSDGRGDLALIRLRTPVPAAHAAVLAHCGPPVRREVRAFGHPRNDPFGRWAIASITGTAGHGNRWVQLNDRQTAGPRIEPGFSGAGVVNDDHRVIGIVVGSDTNAQARGAWMIPVETIIAHLPRLPALVVIEEPSPVYPAGVADVTRLDFEQQLVDLLCEVDVLVSRTDRDNLVHELNRRTDVNVRSERDTQMRVDLLHLVSACLDHVTGDVVDHLVAAVRTLTGESRSHDRMVALLEADRGRGLSGREVHQLAALVDDTPNDHVVAATAAAFDPLGPVHDVDQADAVHLIRAVAQLIGLTDQPPPLLVFLRTLADRQPEAGATRTAFEEWLAFLTRRWALAPPPARPVTQPPTHSYLVVDLREDGPDPDLYLLSIWLEHVWEERPGRPRRTDAQGLVAVDDEPLALDEVTGYIGQQLRRVAQGHCGPTGRITVEMVVPSSLLMRGLEMSWIGTSTGRQPIAVAYPVVLRGAARMHNAAIRHRWQTRWEWLKRNGGHPHAEAIRTIGAESVPFGPFEDDTPVCLVLAAASNAALVGAIHEALNLGLPVLLWCRSRDLDHKFLIEMANQTAVRPAAEIPAVVDRLRAQAAAADDPDDHIGSHLGFVWDDADRIPTVPSFRPPS
jgi:hypothetical protein